MNEATKIPTLTDDDRFTMTMAARLGPLVAECTADRKEQIKREARQAHSEGLLGADAATWFICTIDGLWNYLQRYGHAEFQRQLDDLNRRLNAIPQ